MTVDVLTRKRNVKAPAIRCMKCSVRLANPAERVYVGRCNSVCLDASSCRARTA